MSGSALDRCRRPYADPAERSRTLAEATRSAASCRRELVVNDMVHALHRETWGVLVAKP
jgi:hypothetical protein